MNIANITKHTILARQARVADSFFSRLKGLLGSDALPADTALVIRPCNSVHTFGMRYPIDVIFANAEHRVIKTVTGMGPGKVAFCRSGRYTVELPAGTLDRDGTEAGDQLALSE
jgi:uncharacterized protein